MNKKELMPLINMLSLAESWDIEMDSKGNTVTKMSGNAVSLAKGVKALETEDELEELADKVIAKLHKLQLDEMRKQLQKGWK